MSAWSGQFLDGQTAAVHALDLALEDGTLVGRDGAGVERLRWPEPTIRWAALDEEHTRVTSTAAPDASLTTGAADAAIHLGHVRSLLRRPPRRWLLVVGYGLGAVAAAALVFTSLDPLARIVARRIPRAYEAQLGLGLAQLVAKAYCETPAASAALTRLSERLGGGAAELHILDVDAVNAFTFPGGVVVVTRGLIAASQSSDELAGVLAHELEHATRRHVMIHVVRASLLTLAWQATVGDYSGLLIVDPKTAADIANLRFSRDAEREADRGARDRLGAARISVAGFRRFFERMQAKNAGVPPWLSNHPATAERATSVGEDVGAVVRTPALSNADWAALRAGCVSR